MASAKWLQRLLVTDRLFHRFFQTCMDTVWEHRGGLPDLVPVTALQVKAEMARPTVYEVVSANAPYRVYMG